MKPRRLVPVLIAILLLAGCRAAAWREYHHVEPVEYYFTYPEVTGLLGPPPLFVALLGEGRTPLDCIELFQPSADERHMAVLCPKLGGDDGLADVLQAEEDLAAILTDLYAQYPFQEGLFLTGFADGGEFVLEYGMKYPTAVGGLSAMSVDKYPDAVTAGVPVQILVGESDPERLALAQEIEQAWRERGVLVRMLTVDGDGRAPNRAFARLSSEVTDQVR